MSDQPDREQRMVLMLHHADPEMGGVAVNAAWGPADTDATVWRARAASMLRMNPTQGASLAFEDDGGDLWAVPIAVVVGMRLEYRHAIPPEQRHAQNLGVAEE